MLSIDTIQKNKDKIKGADKILNLDEQRRKLTQEVQNLREERNVTAKAKDVERGKKIKEDLKVKENKLVELEKDLNTLLYSIPNIPLDNVPVGDEKNNKVLRTEGTPRVFDFTPLDHVELGEQLDIIDMKRAAKVSGARFAYFKNEGALLEFALLQYAVQTLVKKGFTPIIPPVLINKEITNTLGYWQHGSEEFYLTDNMYLIGTGEHAVVPMHKDETLDEKDLPKRYVAFSSCFRREAGSYGRDTKGILRMHQFDKVEMVVFCKPEDDERERKNLLNLAENFLKELELPYQVVQLAAGDLALPSAETIDLETWIPSQKKYRETHSISTTTDFQARRLKIKYRQGDKKEFVHILNGTAIAMSRTPLAILENHQQKDGSVLIPKALRPYTGFDKISSSTVK
jgi:seryl-tRNA synthetase